MKRCYGCFESIKDELEICPFCGYIEGTAPEEAIHMEPGTILSGRYIIGKVIGYGGFGVTYIGWDAKLEQRVAIKEYLPSEFSTRMPGQSRVSVFNGSKNEQFLSGLNKFVDEAKRLSKFQNEDGIVRIFDCLAENDTAYIVMEYLEGETLAERLKRDKTIPEKEAIELLLPVMKSLEVVHREGIIHRDIAPDNIFITKEGEVKLIDFGASRFATTSHSRSLTVIIKPGYSAEEQYRSRSDQGPYTDVYSIAATLYKMITGETPPDALERRAKIENAKKDILPEPHKITKEISLVAENAILNALNIRIEDRTQTVEQLISDLTAEEPVKRVYGKIKRIDFYRMPLWLKIMVPALFVVFITFGTLLATGVISFASLFKTDVEVPEGYTIVPEIEGLDIEKATNELKLSSLNYTTGGNVTSDYIAANLIVYQDPESGKIIPKNSVVQITVSRGTGEVAQAVNGISTVPIFVWSEESLAISDFEKAGLTTTIEYIFDENVSAGQVIRATDINGTNIEAGMELPEGTTVILYISKGPEGFSMPNVIGYTENDAKSTLEQLGLIVFVTYEENSNVSPGTVFSQSISAETIVSLATEVSISVATAPETKTATEAPKSIFATNTPIPTPTPLPELTVAFDSNGGNSVPSITRTYGDSIGSLPTPSKEGHTFNGWIYNGSAISSSTVVTSNMTVIASWTANSYTVTYDSNGGSSVASVIRIYGESIGSLPSSTREGYTFGGWSYNGSGVSFDTVVTSDMTLNASWTINTYTISFDSAGGSDISSLDYTYGDKLGDLPEPDRTGYTFNGWSYDGSYVSSSTAVTSNMTLTASWTINTYTIWFDSNGGTSVSSFTRNYGETLGSLTSPKRDYYTFNGWYHDGDYVNSSTVVTDDMTLTAYWSENNWGSWSDWSTSAVNKQYSGDLLIVDVQTEEHPATYKTVYYYDRWDSDWGYPDANSFWCAPYEGWWDYGAVYCGNHKTAQSETPYREVTGGEFTKYYDPSGNFWYNQRTEQVVASSAYTTYRFRTRIK